MVLPCWRAPGAGHDCGRLGTWGSRVAPPCRGGVVCLACSFLRRSPAGQGRPAEGGASRGTWAKGLGRLLRASLDSLLLPVDSPVQRTTCQLESLPPFRCLPRQEDATNREGCGQLKQNTPPPPFQQVRPEKGGPDRRVDFHRLRLLSLKPVFSRGRCQGRPPEAFPVICTPLVAHLRSWQRA